ncbi:MAG: response regulator [Deltaproteobacteria bacterium]|nr:response regulator [Deltaproteobacteria bacterium]
MKPRVLVVDDEEMNAILLSTKFERAGYEVERAKDGFEALQKVSVFHPDIVLLDVMMPRMDGYEALRRLKSKEETRYIPVIMLTGKADVEDKVMGLEVGAEDYISKPYSLQEVAARVKSLLRMRSLQTRLRETEKMAALGEMVDGIAHEIRNPLTAIGGMARRLHEHETDPQHREYADRIIKSVERLERMLQRVDEYKKILVSTLRPGDINGVIADAARDAAEFIENEGKEITVKTDLMERPPLLNLDAGNLRVAIFNVLQNSVEAIEKKGEIRIETRPAFDQTFVLRVSDNGIGIEKDSLRNIFNPFQTSKFQGAGLGLTITYRIIHDHGGEITVESAPGKGTVVTMRFHPVKAVVAAGARAGQQGARY